MKGNWRKNLDPLIKDHLEAVIKESFRYRKSYSKSKEPSKAQLWCAIGILSKQNFDLSLKLKYLEKILYGLVGRKKKGNDIKGVLNSLEKF